MYLKIAKRTAKMAFEEYSSSRRGVWYVDGIVVVYNNHPYAARFPELRDQETAEFRTRIRETGITELAYAIYPPMGQEDGGYTYAMLLAASEDQMETIRDILQAVIMDSWAIIHATLPTMLKVHDRRVIDSNGTHIPTP